MQTLSHSVEASALFNEIALCLNGATKVQLDYLTNLKPLDFEYELQEWRYRLCGFLECLHVSNSLSIEHYERILARLFGNTSHGDRNRKSMSAFNIKVIDNQFVPTNFDVLAINPTDAYHQLSKRMDYRCIVDINRVEIYSGKLTHRTDASSPCQIFEVDSLINP